MRTLPPECAGAEVKMKDFFEKINNSFDDKINSNQYSPLVLAYIGDSVFDMLVRTMIIRRANCPVNTLHKEAKAYVSAVSQAKMFNRVMAAANEEEASVMKRGRNAKSFSKAKNASVIDYRHATGLEALFGYLYLCGKNDRIIELFKICIEENSIEG